MGFKLTGLSFTMFGYNIQLDWARETSWRYVTSSNFGGEIGAGDFLSVGLNSGKFVVESTAHQFPDLYECWYGQVTVSVGAGLINLPGNISMSFEETNSGRYGNICRTNWPWTPDATGEQGDPTGFLDKILFISFNQSVWLPFLKNIPGLAHNNYDVNDVVGNIAGGSSLTVMFLAAPPEDNWAAIAARIAFPMQYAEMWSYCPLFYKYYGLCWGNAITIPTASVGVTVAPGMVTGIYNRRTKQWASRKRGYTTIVEYRR
jgi:hypothetical protein